MRPRQTDTDLWGPGAFGQATRPRTAGLSGVPFRPVCPGGRNGNLRAHDRQDQLFAGGLARLSDKTTS